MYIGHTLIVLLLNVDITGIVGGLIGQGINMFWNTFKSDRIFSMMVSIALLEFGLNRLHTRLKNSLSPQALSWFMLVKIGLYTYIICNMLKAYNEPVRSKKLSAINVLKKIDHKDLTKYTDYIGKTQSLKQLLDEEEFHKIKQILSKNDIIELKTRIKQLDYEQKATYTI
jgi:hypothetical protein